MLFFECYLTKHASGHLFLGVLLAFLVLDGFSWCTSDLGNFELDLAWNQLALPPGHRLAVLVTRPHLKH